MRKKRRNPFETKLHRQLSRAKVDFKYEAERLPYTVTGYYLPDWVIDTPSGKIYIEAKGYFRPEAKRKLVAVKKLNPLLDIRIVFYKERLQYTKWADKHGFPWAVEKIPLEWLSGLETWNKNSSIPLQA